MIDPITNHVRESMKKAIDITRTDISSIRSGRATPALVEHIVIPAYAGTQHLKLLELATITTMDAKTIMIAPYDPTIVPDIERGIMDAKIGLMPIVDGEVIRITIPALSSERRGEYIKLARTKLEGGRIMIRQIRHEGMRELKKLEDEGSLSEDQKKHGEKVIQELTDEMIAEIDTMGEKKEQELLQV